MSRDWGLALLSIAIQQYTGVEYELSTLYVVVRCHSLLHRYLYDSDYCRVFICFSFVVVLYIAILRKQSHDGPNRLFASRALVDED